MVMLRIDVVSLCVSLLSCPFERINCFCCGEMDGVNGNNVAAQQGQHNLLMNPSKVVYTTGSRQVSIVQRSPVRDPSHEVSNAAIMVLLQAYL